MSEAPTLRPAGRHGDWDPLPPRLVALDVDGTLVGPDGSVSDEVHAAIARATEAGLLVGLATGRMALGVADLIGGSALSGPHVLHNGAEVRHEGELLVSWPVAPAALDAALDACAAHDVYLEVYVADGYLVNRLDERARPHWELLGHDPLGSVRHASDVDAPVAKVTAAVFDRSEVPAVVGLLSDAGLRAGAAGSPATPEIAYVNGTHPDADKGSALREAATRLGVDLRATVAVGDAHNDLPLLAAAGTAIAMGQAEQEVRAAAHLLAPDVTADGAAVALDAAVRGWQGAVVATT